MADQWYNAGGDDWYRPDQGGPPRRRVRYLDGILACLISLLLVGGAATLLGDLLGEGTGWVGYDIAFWVFGIPVWALAWAFLHFTRP